MKKKATLYVTTRIAPPTNDDELYKEFGTYPWGRECGVVAALRLGSAVTEVIVCCGVVPQGVLPTIDDLRDHPLTGVLTFTALGQVIKERWLKKIKKLRVIGIFTPGPSETLKGVLDRAEAELVRKGKGKTKAGVPTAVLKTYHTKDTAPVDPPSDTPPGQPNDPENA